MSPPSKRGSSASSGGGDGPATVVRDPNLYTAIRILGYLALVPTVLGVLVMETTVFQAGPSGSNPVLGKWWLFGAVAFAAFAASALVTETVDPNEY